MNSDSFDRIEPFDVARKESSELDPDKLSIQNTVSSGDYEFVRDDAAPTPEIFVTMTRPNLDHPGGDLNLREIKDLSSLKL